MYSVGFHKDGYSESYLSARRQIDNICDHIVLGIISPKRALDEYENIESEYSQENPERQDIFNIIYLNRIKRLISQFLSEKI
jgi:hypothetical protein